MTHLVIPIAAFTFMLNSILFGHDKPVQKVNDNLYCAQLKDSLLVLMRNGEQLKEDIIFDNGTEVKTDGRVIFPDGVKATLKEGECVDKNGIIASEKAKPMKN